MKRFFSHLPAWVEVGGGQFAGQRQHQRDGMLGGGDGIAEGRVHHDDAGGGGGGNVHIVHADAGAADHFQVLGRLQHVGGELGGRTNGDAVIIADDLDQLFLGEAGLDVGFDAPLRKMATAAGDSLSAIRTLGMGAP
jgi:hypothetical protein